MTTRARTVIVMEDPNVVKHSAEKHAENAPLFFLSGILVFAVLAFGAVEPWAIFIVEVCAALLFLERLWRVSSARDPFAWQPLYPAMLWLCFVGFAQLVFATSVYAWITRSELKGLLCLVMLFFAACQIFTDYPPIKLFFHVLAYAGFAIAVFALVQQFAGNGKMYWVRTIQHGGSFLGPYVNKNHYAGLIEMLFPLGLFLAFSTKGIEKRVLLSFVSVVMAGSIFVSGSRGGIIACVLQLLLIAALFSTTRRQRNGKYWVGAVLAAVFVLIWWLNDRQLAERLLTLRDPLSGATSGNRLQILRDSLPLIRQHPWIGSGLGTFPTVYPAFRSFYSELWMNAGHNDYLQLIVETGLAGALSLLWFFWVYISRFRQRLKDWQHLQSATLRMGALVSCAGLLIHSALDFNLHIPANACLFFVLCAIATGSGIRQHGS
jgi:O-antigen ligase